MAAPFRIHCLLHVPFEGPAVIGDWARKNRAVVTFTRFYENEVLPDPSPCDMVVVMGGPMNVYDFHLYPWMEEEIGWVGRCTMEGKPVLGICLGAQVIAAALGAEVHPGPFREIGWHNLQFLPALGEYRICRELPASRKVFHWHGDSFDLPKGASLIASSRAFVNQGFIFKNTLAFQFHLEVSPGSVRDLVDNCRDDLIPGPHVQTEQEILEEQRYYRSNQELMFRFLDYLRGLI